MRHVQNLSLAIALTGAAIAAAGCATGSGQSGANAQYVNARPVAECPDGQSGQFVGKQHNTAMANAASRDGAAYRGTTAAGPRAVPYSAPPSTITTTDPAAWSTTAMRGSSTPAMMQMTSAPTSTMARDDAFGADPMFQQRGFAIDNAADTTGQMNLYGEFTNQRTGRRPADGSTNMMQVSAISEGGCADPDIDRSGQLMVFSSTMHSPNANLYLQRVGGRTVTQLTSGPYDDVMPRFSPDGDRVAFASNREGTWNIFVMSVDGGQPTQITANAEAELHPSWSPDGATLAFCKLGMQSQRWEIWVLDVERPAAPKFLDYGLFPKWSPDVRQSRILFQRSRQRGSRYHSIWTVDFVDGDAIRPTEIISAANAAIINPAWSPDGERIAFVSVVDPQYNGGMVPEQSDIWIVNADGTGRTNLTDGQFANFQPVWAKDNRVFFVSNRNGVDNVWAVSTRRATNIGGTDRQDLAGVDSSGGMN